ncbi:MAG: 4-hydroxy-tetrahydrodipicolinate reductase [Sphaerochaeta sp.]|jgi:4-hydroxy-tetrahydrodipicolinate reductase
MKIAIVGYGTMGKALAAYAQEQGHTIVAIIDRHTEKSGVTHPTVSKEALAQSEVVIEFAGSEGLEERVSLYGELKIPAVVATTGWYDRLDVVAQIATSTGASILWSGNFAIGVQLFYRIVANAAKLFNPFDEYDVLINEWFHAKKADSPSGTAVTLGKILIDNLERKKSSETARLDRRRDDDEIHVTSSRGGYTAGEHTVIFDSPSDTITLKHASRSRQGYLAGSLQAAAWIVKDRPGFHSLEEMLDEVLKS